MALAASSLAVTPAENSGAGRIPTAMISSMFGQTMPEALEKLKNEAPRAARKPNGP